MSRHTLLLLAIVALSSSYPVWPKTWTSDMRLVTINNVTVTGVSDGTYWYDYTQLSLRKDLSYGQIDPFCQSVSPSTNTCTLIFNTKGMYILFPQSQSCCFCCPASAGCTTLKPTWMFNAVAQGEVQINSRKCTKYLVQGGSANYWYQDAQGVPCEMDNGGFEIFVFDAKTFSTAPINPSIFEIPSTCTDICPQGEACWGLN
eukprot:TRINITY_DN13021_c0_g1_i1.p1 TRINITY_DN13021_c0_g1~~TRINITY_DN13021_c0_g1_i1.p1  ORF type:complete len:214 (-),score=17.46 TRINITY_DN13021_c0_g1_i1:184-789(-)